MRVIVGPLASGSATMWVTYARTVIGQALARGGPNALDTTLVEGFEGMLDEWERLAMADPEFSWSIELDADQARFLTHAFFNIVTGLADQAERRGYPISPPEGEEFYRALVASLLDALETEGGALASFAEDLRYRWPGIKDE